jgi:hypothetical protein
MKEELTTKMHSEFSINKEDEIRHMVWFLLSRCKDSGKSIEEELKFSVLTMEQVEKYRQSYFDLNK